MANFFQTPGEQQSGGGGPGLWQQLNDPGNLFGLNPPGQSPLESQLGQIGLGSMSGLQNFGGGLSNQAMQNLMQLLQGNGINQQGLNRQLAGISADTQSQQGQLQGQLARLGIQNSGVGQAIGGAIGQGGTELRSQARADEFERAEQRKRQDLQLFNMLVGQPGIDAAALSLGQFNRSNDQNSQKQAAGVGALGSLLGGLICWVAREVYGIDDPRWLYARHYILNMGSAGLRETYLRTGPQVAEIVRANPVMKPVFKRYLDVFVARAKRALGR